MEQILEQGSLTEREGLVRLTSSLRQLVLKKEKETILLLKGAD